MILLVDANALLWALEGNAELAPGAAAALIDPSNDIVVSAATVLEIAIKRGIGKLRTPADLTTGIVELGFATVSVTADDGERAGGLPLHHRDPFDRMLVAQAQRLGAVIVSRDAAFDAYGVDRLEA